MPDVRVTDRAAEVLRRGLDAARLDASRIGIRVWRAGGETRSAFSDEPERGDAVVEQLGLRLFFDEALASSGGVLDVTTEHETLVFLDA